MDSKLLISLFLVFGVLCVFVRSERLSFRGLDDANDDSDDDSGQFFCSNSNLVQNCFSFGIDEKQALREFLQDEDGANQFIQQSRRFFSSPKSLMKEAREKSVNLSFALTFSETFFVFILDTKKNVEPGLVVVSAPNSLTGLPGFKPTILPVAKNKLSIMLSFFGHISLKTHLL